MKKRTLFERLFWTPNYFTIAIRKRDAHEASIWERKHFQPDYVMPATRDHWVADPMLAEDNGKTYIFYEAAHHGKGRIEVVELYDNGTTSQPAVALEREYHLSYPFVFKHGGEWYMIPESCAIHEVQLLKATHFPTDWEYVTTLLKENAVDSTVQSVNGKLLLLTFLPQAGSERVFPKAFWLDWDSDIKLTEIPWPNFDPLQVRGAGRMIADGERYVRPAQINQETSYGDGLLFAECCCSNAGYAEKEVGRILAEDLCVPRWKIDGLHTYAATKQFEVVDVRCQLPDPFKILRRIFKI